MMTKNILLLFVLIILYSCGSTKKSASFSAGNPIFKGWYADPEGVIFDKEYWVYPTFSAPYEDQVFLDAFSSKDLTKWKKHEKVLDTSAIKWAKKAIWAPSIIEKDKKYFIFFGANDIQSDNEIGGIGVGISDQPEGPFKDYLGKPLIDKFYNGAQPIDQFVFKDSDGQHYLYYGGWRHCNVAKLNNDFTGFIPFENGSLFKEITPENYVEGPFMFIKDGKYYFMWSEGGWTGPNYSVSYAIADSPLGPFKRRGTILQQDTSIANGAGHHSVIHNQDTDDYYIVYHRRPFSAGKARDSRETCIDRMYFNEDGTIKPIVMTLEGVKPNKIK
tara:strand:+ start:8584 stop:9573 length:990 start_codon:yes stop_codon:yes gene_type:complete